MKYILYILLIINISSCQNTFKNETSKDVIIDSIELKPRPDYRIDRNDSICIKEIERAKEDIENGIFEYSIHDFGRKYIHQQEIRELLNSKNIKYSPLGENCTDELNCYGYHMDSVIRTKYGDDFIDSILIESKKLSDSKWKTKIYNSREVDSIAYYLNSDSENTIDDFIKSKIHLPDGWKRSGDVVYIRQDIFLELIIDNKGKPFLLENKAELNLKKENKKFSRQILNQIINSVRSMKPWIPAKLNGHKVKTEQLLYINFDE